jgi:hypothetical protein
VSRTGDCDGSSTISAASSAVATSTTGSVVAAWRAG